MIGSKGGSVLPGTMAPSYALIATILALSGAEAFVAPRVPVKDVASRRTWASTSTARQSRASAFTWSSLASCAGLLVAGFVRSSRRDTPPTTMFFKRKYGGPIKQDFDAEYGPQYHGFKGTGGIQRSSRLGFPKAGQQRVIPKLSGASWEYRKNMMRNLTTQIIRSGRIKTTRARAEALTHFVDRMILLAKRGDDLSRREAGEWLYDEALVNNLFQLGPDRYKDREKGFTKVTRTMNRQGDWSEMAYIELV
ncbi:unnamed protein product [Cladocopium goreaui]|uniref:50S ribosomal protein L17 n=1 Tax=Cladocopium goreaui TaxID=2562237 RepID=A0A9P1BVS3_9DINO|nr:unnamed protein product [Cladocopium goreaui]